MESLALSRFVIASYRTNIESFRKTGVWKRPNTTEIQVQFCFELEFKLICFSGPFYLEQSGRLQ